MNKNEVAKLAVMENEIKNLGQKLNVHIDDQKTDFETVNKNILTLATKIDNLMNTFAGKWVEKVTLGILITVGSGVLVAGIIFVIKFFFS